MSTKKEKRGDYFPYKRLGDVNSAREISSKKYRYDLFNPSDEFEEDTTLFDETEFMLITAWTRYIKSIEGVLWSICCNHADSDVERQETFLKLVVNSSTEEFNHLFHISDASYQFLNNLSNLEPAGKLLKLLKTNNVFFFAKNLRDNYVSGGRFPSTIMMKSYFLQAGTVNGKIVQKRELVSDFSDKPLEDLVEFAIESKNAVRALTGLKALTDKAKKKQYTSEFLPSIHTGLLSLADKIGKHLCKKEEKTEDSTMCPDLGAGKNNVVTTGNYVYDEIMGGSGASSVNIICAPSGHGKTQEMVEQALEAVVKKGLKVLFVSPEIPVHQVRQRVTSMCMRGYDFTIHNKGGYSDSAYKAMLTTLEKSPSYNKIKNNLRVLDYEKFKRAYGDPKDSMRAGKEIIKRLSDMQEKEKYDIIYIDSIYSFVDGFLDQSKMINFLEDDLAKPHGIPVWVSTQLKKSEGKSYLDKDTSYIPHDRLLGGANVVNAASSTIAVINGQDDDGNLIKKYFYMKKRLSNAKSSHDVVPIDKSMATYSIQEDPNCPSSAIQRYSVSDIIVKELADMGLSGTRAKVEQRLKQERINYYQQDSFEAQMASSVTPVSQEEIDEIERMLDGNYVATPIEKKDKETDLVPPSEGTIWTRRIRRELAKACEGQEMNAFVTLTDEQIEYLAMCSGNAFSEYGLWGHMPPVEVINHWLATDGDILEDKVYIEKEAVYERRKEHKQRIEEMNIKYPETRLDFEPDMIIPHQTVGSRASP
jgi:thymidine kinase